MLESRQGFDYEDPGKTFSGVRFVLLGFDAAKIGEIRAKLVDGAGVDVGDYGPSCTHLIVDKLIYDDPICVTARREGKTVVTGLWVDHSFDVGMPVDPTSVMYRPPRNLSGIPGAKSLVICLTGYQRQDRDDIMTMVGLMGANFSKPLIANKVTHLICYKFEGEKYELAKKMKRIKLVNHRWLEDCLREWELLPEANYGKSGHDLEMMEAEAKDSEEETEDVEMRKDLERSVNNPQDTQTNLRSLLAKQDVLGNSIDMGVSHSFVNSGTSNEVAPATGNKTVSDQSPFQVTRNRHSSSRTGNLVNMACGMSSEIFADMIISENVQNKLLSTSQSDKRSPHSDVPKLNGQLYSMTTPRKSCLPLWSEKTGNNKGIASMSNVEKPSGSRGFDISPSGTNNNVTDSDGLKTPNNGNRLHPEAAIDAILPGKRKLTNSCDSSKSQRSRHSPKTGLTGESLTKKEALNGMPDGVSPVKITRYLDENAALVPADNVNISEGFASEIREECHGEANQTSNCIERASSVTTPEGQEISLGKGDHPKTEVDAQQDDLQNIQLPTSGTKTSNVEKSSGLVDSDLPNGGDTTSMSKPLRRLVLAKKTLGPRPSLSNGSTKKLKVLAKLPKTNLQDDSVSLSIEAEKSGCYEDEKDEMVPEGGIREKNQNIQKHNSQEIGNEAMNRSETMEETEAPDDREESILDVVDDGKPADVEKTHLVDSWTVKGEGKHDTEKQADGDKDKKAQVRRGRNSVEANRSVVSEKDQGSEEIPKDNAGKKQICRGTKRALNKTKGKKCLVAKETENSGEDAQQEGCSTDQHEKNAASSSKEHISLEDKAKKAGIKKPKKSAEDEKENKPVAPEGQSAPSKSSKMPEKYNSKADMVDIGSVSGEKILNDKTEPAWFILSGHRLQRKEFQKVIRRLKGRLCRDSHQWSYQATHFIVPDPLRRTEKFFAAAASGSWILKTDYLSACNEAGKFLPEEPYEWHKKCLSEDGAINLEAPRKWRLLKERTGHGAFYGMRVVIYGECIAPPLDTLKRAVKAGDGIILATSPPYTRFLQSGVDFAIVSPGMPRVDMWVQEFIRHEIPCVLADYLVEYVCKPGFSLERHVQYNTHALAEKSLKKLVKRVEEVPEDLRTPEADRLNDVACQVCGSRDRGEEMLICGGESGSAGCGIGTHIYCCNPPLEDIPMEDWFCPNCSKKKESKRFQKGSKKQNAKSKK